MKKGKMMSLLIAGALLLGVAQMPGCSHDDTAIVTIQLQYMGDSVHAFKTDSLLNKIFRFFVPNAYATIVTWEGNWNTLSLTITGEDIDTITASLPAGVTQYRTEVPAGAKRTFTVLAYDSDISKTVYVRDNWGGHEIVDLNANQETTISVKMFPMTKMSSVGGSTGFISVSWYDISSLYTYTNPIKGYYLYRATAPDGTYSKIYTGTTASYTDNSVVSGTTYYYKVSIFTSGGEGEMCAYLSGKAN